MINSLYRHHILYYGILFLGDIELTLLTDRVSWLVKDTIKNGKLRGFKWC